MVGYENERTKQKQNKTTTTTTTKNKQNKNKNKTGKFTIRQVSAVFSKCGVQSKRKYESYESCVCIVRFSACVCQKKSVVYETECRHVAVQRGKQGQNRL